MMSISEMIALSLRLGTKEDAKKLVDQRVQEMVSILGYDADQARRTTLQNIGYYTTYIDNESADKVMDLFETEHPYFGRRHPTGEEAWRLSREHHE